MSVIICNGSLHWHSSMAACIGILQLQPALTTIQAGELPGSGTSTRTNCFRTFAPVPRDRGMGDALHRRDKYCALTAMDREFVDASAVENSLHY